MAAGTRVKSRRSATFAPVLPDTAMSDRFVPVRPFAQRLHQQWRRWRLPAGSASTPVGDIDPNTFAAQERIPFRCNLCGTANTATLAELSREIRSCACCGSTVRFRAMAHLLTQEICGHPTALPDMAPRRDIAGIGLSDAAEYARPLAKKFAYKNTWFHTAPQLDIANVDPALFGRYDFLIASDVFEHVVPPVQRAFANARRLLKPTGIFIFTVPFLLEPTTREHFPDLHEWSMADHAGTWKLTNRTRDGREQTFDDLVFHGGPGTTLEMRLFSHAALEAEFAEAGFARMRIAAEPYLPFGIHWPEPWSVPMVAYAS
jgi:SAM-dependent methyltransferase